MFGIPWVNRKVIEMFSDLKNDNIFFFRIAFESDIIDRSSATYNNLKSSHSIELGGPMVRFFG